MKTKTKTKKKGFESGNKIDSCCARPDTGYANRCHVTPCMFHTVMPLVMNVPEALGKTCHCDTQDTDCCNRCKRECGGSDGSGVDPDLEAINAWIRYETFVGKLPSPYNYTPAGLCDDLELI